MIKSSTNTTMNNDVCYKITMYKNTVSNKFLDVAENLKNNSNADLVILSIATAYIEGNQQYRDGKTSKGESEEFFIKGVRRIFEKENVPRKILHNYYDQVRCGLFHDGMVRQQVTVSCDFPDALRYIHREIRINPHMFLARIKRDLDQYIDDLAKSKRLRRNFIKRYDMTM